MFGWWFNPMRQRERRAELAHELHFQQRMQFHTVFRHANLPVENIKETDAFHSHHPCVRKATEMRLRL